MKMIKNTKVTIRAPGKRRRYPPKPGYSPLAPIMGTWIPAGEDLDESGKEAANQIVKEEAEMAEGIFDIVPKDPEVEHVAEDMQEAPWRNMEEKRVRGAGIDGNP